MNQFIVRGALGGAALGSLIGGAVSAAMILLLQGLQPVVFLTCGIYAGVVYGGIVGAVRAARHAPEPAYAINRRLR